ncbi:MAG: DegT/DnrJ/EryC1/StrS family aminotransferase [Bacillota bacterium]
MFVPLSSPDITEKEITAVNEVLQTRFLALGPKLVEFEEKMAGCVGRRFGVAVNSGTSGLHLLVRALGIGEGDEVITTPFSFIASANCILFERARPVFVDIDPDTLNINPGLIDDAITPRTKAILPVHAFGQPAEMDTIMEIAARHGLKVIEDACEAIGSRYQGEMAGTFGDGAVFAFYPNKQMTTGEGGMIVTDNEEVARLCRSMRNQGRGEGGGWLDHERLGYNYRMDELSAALGLAQLERLPEMLARRAQVAEMYNRRLAELEEVRVPYVSPQVEMSWFVYVVRLSEEINRDAVMAHLRFCGVQCRPYFTPIYLQPFYRQMFGYKEGDFPVTEQAGRSVVALPFFNNLTEEQVDYVVRTLKEAIAIYRD